MDITKSKSGEMIRLNDLFDHAVDAYGATPGQAPKEWMKLESASRLLVEIGSEVGHLPKGGDFPPLIEAKKGSKNGGTYAHWHVALAYAMYLSPALQVKVQKAYVEHVLGSQPPPVPRITDRELEDRRANRLMEAAKLLMQVSPTDANARQLVDVTLKHMLADANGEVRALPAGPKPFTAVGLAIELGVKVPSNSQASLGRVVRVACEDAGFEQLPPVIRPSSHGHHDVPVMQWPAEAREVATEAVLEYARKKRFKGA